METVHNSLNPKSEEAAERELEAYDIAKMYLESCPMFIELWDSDLNIIDCNQNMVDAFGCSDKDEFIRRYDEFVPEFQPCGRKTEDVVKEGINKVLTEGRTQLEWTHILPNGELLPVQLTGVRVTHKGKTMIIGYNHDLRPMKETQAKLEEANLMSEFHLKSAPYMINIWDEDLNLLSTSGQSKELFGLSGQDYIDRFFELSPEYQPCGTLSSEKHEKNMALVLSTGVRLKTEWMCRTLDGEPLPTEITYVRFEQRGNKMVAVYVTDLRPVKIAIENERSAEERAKVLIDASPVACFLLDGKRRAIDCNEAALELFIKEPGKPLSDTYPDNGLIQTCAYGFGCKEYVRCGREVCRIRNFLIANYRSVFPDYEQNKVQIEKSLADCCDKALREGTQQFEFVCTTFYGLEIPTETIISPVKLQDGDGFAVNIMDRRDEKRRELAEEESRAKTRFLARMSHELRTPMNAVIGITELQLQKDQHPQETEEAFLRIHTSSNLLLKIINDILDLSRIEADKMDIIHVEYEVASLIADTVQLNIIHTEDRPVEFKLKINPWIPSHLIGDEQRIKQVLNNLLSNAFKYTSKGVVVLSFGMEAVGGEVNLVICVQDTGQGMSDEQVNVLFGTEYLRFNLQGNRDIEGSGLGMLISHHLINIMGGDIEVESELGVGSTFTVRIPQTPASSNVLGKETTESLQNLNFTKNFLRKTEKFTPEPMPYGRVLVVDDVETNLYVAKSCLDSYKVAVDMVTGGRDAVEKIKAGEKYDIIFMDHMMPDMDGVEATRLIRRMGYTHPIVALTANAVKGTPEMFLGNGFDGFIAKPIDIKLFDSYLVRFIRNKYILKQQSPAKPGKGFAPHSPGNAKSRSAPNDLMASFVRDAQRAIDILESSIESLKSNPEFDEESLKQCAVQSHAIKSAANYLGMKDLSEAAYELEQAALDDNIHALLAKTPTFVRGLRGIVKQYS